MATMKLTEIGPSKHDSMPSVEDAIQRYITHISFFFNSFSRMLFYTDSGAFLLFLMLLSELQVPIVFNKAVWFQFRVFPFMC